MITNQNYIYVYSNIFIEKAASIAFLRANIIIEDRKECGECSTGSMKLKNDRSKVHGCYMQCMNCKRKTNLFCNSIFKKSKIPVNILLRVVYGFVSNFDIFQIQLISELSPITIISLRKKIMSVIKNKRRLLFPRIGGLGVRVQIDETAICRGKIITNPSSSLDDIEGIQWLVGGIEETEDKRIFLEIVPNRRHDTILSLLQSHVIEGSEIITDGYPSYPTAVQEFGSSHSVVLHSEGFINYSGDHTNLIENLWSHFKVEYRIRRGIIVSRMEDFVFEFYFKKMYVKKRTLSNISSAFRKLLEILLKN